MTSKEDAVYLVLFIAGITAIAIMVQSEVMPRDFGIVGMFVLIVLAATNVFFKSYLERKYTKVFTRALTEHWMAIRNEIIEASNKYAINYNLKIPENYVPRQQIEFSEIPFSIHTIDRRDAMRYGIEYTHPSQSAYTTIVYHTEKQKIVGVLKLDFEKSIEFLKNNRDLFIKGTIAGIIPSVIEKISYGQPMKMGK